MANTFGHTFPPDSWGRKTTIPQIPLKRVLLFCCRPKSEYMYIPGRQDSMKMDLINYFMPWNCIFKPWLKKKPHTVYTAGFVCLLRDATIHRTSPQVLNPSNHQKSQAAQGDTPAHSWRCRAPSWHTDHTSSGDPSISWQVEHFRTCLRVRTGGLWISLSAFFVGQHIRHSSPQISKAPKHLLNSPANHGQNRWPHIFLN